MKCYIAILLLALFAVAFAQSKPADPKKDGPLVDMGAEEPPRDKRGVLLSYASPYAYTSYSAPLSYNVPYAYRTYPYFYNSYYL